MKAFNIQLRNKIIHKPQANRFALSDVKKLKTQLTNDSVFIRHANSLFNRAC